jgi:molybdenum cofactor biosynthesis protein B
VSSGGAKHRQEDPGGTTPEESPAAARKGESASIQEHRAEAPRTVATAVVTVSDTRTLEDDAGGRLIVELLEGAGHSVASRVIVKDEPTEIAFAVESAASRHGIGAVIVTGGTGVAPRDVTPDTIEPLLDRTIPGFGELYRMLSYQEVGSAALLSRALAGLKDGRVVFALPGSRGAVRLAMEKLILPELGHLVAQAVKKR